MSTVIGSMTGVHIKSPFFSDPKNLELFIDSSQSGASPKQKRVALLYGANGSGKSTLAQGFREYAESKIPRTVEVIPISGGNQLLQSTNGSSESIYVFDETYISNNIKLQQDSLGSIVLFGQQVEIEQKIQKVEADLALLAGKIEKQNEVCKKHLDVTNIASPNYWSVRITKALQSPGGWAEINGIRIKKHQIKSKVTETEIRRLGQLVPDKSQENIKIEFEKLISVFEKTSSSSDPISPQISTITIPYNILSMTKIKLAAKPKSVPLTEREHDLLDLMGIATLVNAKGFLSSTSKSVCSLCLQPISEQHRNETLTLLDKILNRDIEDYQESLRALMIPSIPEDKYDAYSCVDSMLVEKIRSHIRLANNAIDGHNSALKKKIDEPMENIEYEDSHEVGNTLLSLNALLAELEKKRCAFNKVIADRKKTEKQLMALNDLLGHFVIIDDYAKMIEQMKIKESNDFCLISLRAEDSKLKAELKKLNALRRNYSLALDQINKSLSYIYFSKKRIEVVLESDQRYHLKVNGQPVTPDKISCGERNALALCYFFTEIAKETELNKMYNNECLLVIDDPVSSFDIENRVGILSFLRFKLNQILLACATTKVVVMTHDISVLFDLQKAMEEISSICKSNGKSADFISIQLVNKNIIPFLTKKHNEYTDLMNSVYDYACNPTDEKDLSIGNITRRLFEAFSTFMFKEGIDKVSLNPLVLSLVADQHKREYFQHSMYRLVLNTESHSQEAMQGAPEASFYSHISRSEKQRTTKDILCFMYTVNEIHVLSHIPQAKNDICNWLEEI